MTLSAQILPAPAVQDIRSAVRPSRPAAPNRENPNLDFLRTFAVLLVLVGHLTCFAGRLTLGPLNLLLMGSLGVLFFFVHTCLVLMLSLERRWDGYFSDLADKLRASKIFFLDFMLRRCFRIYPLSITVVLLIVIFHLPQATVEPSHFYSVRPDFGDLIANLFLVQNLTMRMPLLGPMWSLAYELQMYLLLPWLFLLIRPLRTLGRVTAAWAVSVALALIVLHYRPNPSIFLFLPCFFPGIVAYQLQRTVRPRVPAFLWPLFIAALAAFFMVGPPGEHWLKKWATCLLLGLAIPIVSPIKAPWLVSASHVVAKYSYGIYLTHFFAIWFAFEFLGQHAAAQKTAVFVMLAAGLPILFYHAIEEPMIRVGKSIADRYVAAVYSEKLPAIPS
jgi:peptidoglycan/LPS O-acetylase OafA/YrhL